MKRLTLLTAAFALFAFAACNDDNNGETPAATPAEEIAGAYSVYTTASFFSYAPQYENETITLTANADGPVALSYANETWGTFASNLTVTKEGNAYSVSGEGTVNMGMGSGEPKDYAFTVTGSVVSATDAAFTIAIPAAMNLSITFKTGKIDYPAAIAGTYKGYTSVTFTHASYSYEDQEIVITANSDGTASLYFNDADNTEWLWGEYDLADITIARENVDYVNTYSISGSGSGLYVGPMSEGGDPLGPYDYTMEGSIVSTEKAEITFTLPFMGGVTVKFVTGTPPAEEEPAE